MSRKCKKTIQEVPDNEFEKKNVYYDCYFIFDSRI